MLALVLQLALALALALLFTLLLESRRGVPLFDPPASADGITTTGAPKKAPPFGDGDDTAAARLLLLAMTLLLPKPRRGRLNALVAIGSPLMGLAAGNTISERLRLSVELGASGGRRALTVGDVKDEKFEAR